MTLLSKFVQTQEVCFNVGYPTAFGWLIIVGLVILSVIVFVKNKS